MPELRANTGDFFFLSRKSGEAAVDTILDLCAERLPNRMGIRRRRYRSSRPQDATTREP